MTTSTPKDFSALLSEPWNAFIDLTAAHRPALFAFGRQLTGNAFDGEDLVQDAIIRAFGAAAVQHGGVGDLRSYLFRTMSNLWIDQQRRTSSILVGEIDGLVAEATAGDKGGDPAELASEFRDAARRLFDDLAPRERAAVVLHEGFGFAHRDIARMLATTEGAIRSALHRGRRRLAEESSDERPADQTVDRTVLDAFVAAFQDGDVEAIRPLLIEDVRATVFPYPVGQGAEHAIAEGWINGSLYHHDQDRERDRSPFPSRLAAAEIDGKLVVVVERGGDGGMLLEEVWLVATDDGSITTIQDYCFSPDLVGFVGAALDLPVRALGYHF